MKHQLLNRLFEVELEYVQVISPLIVDKQSWKDWAINPLYKNIEKEGKVL